MVKAIEMQTYTEETGGIKITVHPQYLSEHSSTTEQEYAFAYTVTIENHSNKTVQLLSRHWYVSSGGVPITEVVGDGVVGEQPILQPGEGFQYTSGTVIKDSVGSMYGTYTFCDDNGEAFDVVIPRFDLIDPQVIH